jgi:hypothetical protein
MNNLSNQNIPAEQIQNFGLNDHQDLNNPMNTTANNYQNNPSAPQTQTLSSATNTPSTSQQRTTGGISHAAGVVGALGGTGMAFGSFASGGGIYNAAYLGGTLLNYGLRNGLRF